MKEVNGTMVFNGTPHPLTFWKPGWEDVITVDVDQVINALPTEVVVKTEGGITFVKTVFQQIDKAFEIIATAQANGAQLIVGSIIAAQAYPGLVVSMVPAPGYERVPPDSKRMLPDKFNIF